MPTVTLEVTVTDNQAAKIQKWFERWNAQRPVPYANLKAALEDLLLGQLENYVTAENRTMLESVKDAYLTADDATQDQVLTDLGLLS